MGPVEQGLVEERKIRVWRRLLGGSSRTDFRRGRRAHAGLLRTDSGSLVSISNAGDLAHSRLAVDAFVVEILASSASILFPTASYLNENGQGNHLDISRSMMFTLDAWQ